MAGGGIWHKTLVYFGLADEDDEYDDETLSVGPDVEPTYKDRPNVRKLDRTGRRRQAAPPREDRLRRYRRLGLRRAPRRYKRRRGRP